MFFDFFKSNNIKTVKTDKGSHSSHWYAIFGEKTNGLIIMDRIHKSLERGEQKKIDDIVTITDSLVRSVIKNEALLTSFPVFKGLNYHKIETQKITEWSHIKCLEAIISAKHPCGGAINFFATDYAINKNLYKNTKDIYVNISCLIYKLESFDINEYNKKSDMKFDDNFCGYFPGDLADEIQFVGRIKSFNKHNLAEIKGYLLTLEITTDFLVEMFIAEANLNINLEDNKHIYGYGWIQGSFGN